MNIRPRSKDGVAQTGNGAPLQLWIMGNSFIYWARRSAAIQDNDRQLGFPEEAVLMVWVSGDEMGAGGGESSWNQNGMYYFCPCKSGLSCKENKTILGNHDNKDYGYCRNLREKDK
ncbi:uncharacterized protein O3C94_002861 [Discoglossus pictus]